MIVIRIATTPSLNASRRPLSMRECTVSRKPVAYSPNVRVDAARVVEGARVSSLHRDGPVDVARVRTGRRGRPEGRDRRESRALAGMDALGDERAVAPRGDRVTHRAVRGSLCERA